MPYVNRINTLATKIYDSRTILFLKKDVTLKPVAIKLRAKARVGSSNCMNHLLQLGWVHAFRKEHGEYYDSCSTTEGLAPVHTRP